jgi:hypothetical protein
MRILMISAGLQDLKTRRAMQQRVGVFLNHRKRTKDRAKSDALLARKKRKRGLRRFATYSVQTSPWSAPGQSVPPTEWGAWWEKAAQR